MNNYSNLCTIIAICEQLLQFVNNWCNLFTIIAIYKHFLQLVHIRCNLWTIHCFGTFMREHSNKSYEKKISIQNEMQIFCWTLFNFRWIQNINFSLYQLNVISQARDPPWQVWISKIADLIILTKQGIKILIWLPYFGLPPVLFN